MPSQFPGMDPYLENPDRWPGFHTAMMVAIRAALTPQLPVGFYAEIERHYWYREEAWTADELASFEAKLQANPVPGCTPPTYRAILPKIIREEGQVRLQIRDAKRNRVAAIIDLLTPANKKPGEERRRFIRTRNDFLANGTHSVVIDLLRDGERLPADPQLSCDYYIYVTDANSYSRVSVWAFTVRDPFPPFDFPLASDQSPVALFLKGCFDRVYDEANYGPQMEYHRPVSPPLKPADASWAADITTKPIWKTN